VSAEQITRFFASGMLLNVLASMQVHGRLRPWSKSCSTARQEALTLFFPQGGSDDSHTKASMILDLVDHLARAFMVSLDNLAWTTAIR